MGEFLVFYNINCPPASLGGKTPVLANFNPQPLDVMAASAQLTTARLSAKIAAVDGNKTMRICWLGILLAVSFTTATQAWTKDEVMVMFDARELDASEIMFLQAALALKSDYVGMVDGKWGAGSLSALQNYIRESGLNLDVNNPPNLAPILVVAETISTLVDQNWSRYYFDFANLSFISPRKTMALSASENGLNIDFNDTASSLAISLTSGDVDRTIALHQFALDNAVADPYVVRKENMAITSTRLTGGKMLYVRSDFVANGEWSTMFISALDEDAGRLALVTSSILPYQGPELILPDGGNLYTGVMAFLEMGNQSPAPSSDQGEVALAPPSSQAESSVGTGTGFAVTQNGVILTNSHVAGNCQSVTVDGLPATLIGKDEEFDLALLRVMGALNWPSVNFSERPAPLNADVTVAGYPLTGLLGGLNVTRGSVASVKGLGGDGSTMQISAPVQPGNSGGPVVDAHGQVVGVVVAKLDAKVVQDAIGDIPQNVNFAIRGEIAKLFLYQNGVTPQISDTTETMAPEDLGNMLEAVTHLVTCN